MGRPESLIWINDLTVNQELFLLFPSPLGSATFWCPWPGLNSGGIRGSAEWRKIKFLPCVRNMMQQETGDLKESEHGNVDFGTTTDDEEVTIPSQDRNKEVPDFPDIDIRDEQTLSNTQREDWLLPTEPLHGARPRQTGRERPPVIDNRPPMDATGGAAVWKPGRTLLLSPGQQILMEEEVITPPRGGGIQPMSLRVHHVGYKQYL